MKFHADRTVPVQDGNLIFVFGSNLAGRHGIGAAKAALRFGATYGQGIGLMGNSFAIPTKDEKLRTLNLKLIKLYISDFVTFTKDHKDLHYFVTRVGCGLAGYKDADIAPLFRDAINCSFATDWKRYI